MFGQECSAQDKQAMYLKRHTEIEFDVQNRGLEISSIAAREPTLGLPQRFHSALGFVLAREWY